MRAHLVAKIARVLGDKLHYLAVSFAFIAVFRSFFIVASRGGAEEEAVELYRIAPRDRRVEHLIVLNMVENVDGRRIKIRRDVIRDIVQRRVEEYREMPIFCLSYRC